MSLDRQFLVEVCDAQGGLVARGSLFLANTTGSRVTGTAAGAAASLVTWAGNGQSAVAGATVISPAVRALDANGLPVAGSTVTFQLGTGTSAAASSMTQTTDSNGVATVGSWSVGTNAGGASTLQARSGNLTNSPLTFTITPTAASAFSTAVSAGNSQTSTPASQLASRLSVLVHDRYGNPVSGQAVTWTSSSGDATFGTNPGTTNSSGIAGTTYVTGQSASTESVWAAISSATSARFGVGVLAAVPQAPEIVAGNGQTALSGTTLPTNPTVFVGDGFSNPYSSVTVDFVLVAGSGNLSQTSGKPGSGGTVDVGWQLGTTEAINLLEMSLRGISASTITFTASGTNPLADTIAIESGNNQSATVGTALSLPLAVATLGSGSSASGQIVTWSVATGSLSTTITHSSTSGIARTVWTMPTGAGSHTATASAGTLSGSPLTFTGTATAGTATQLVVTTQPTSGPAPGVAWPQQPVVISADQYGNPVSTNTRVGAVLASGDGTLDSAVSTYAIASGATATFSGLSYTYVSSLNLQVEFEARSLSTATATAQVSQPPFASQLAFSQQPVGGVAGDGIGTVTVAVQDALGTLVPTATNAVTLALGDNTEGATLSGTVSQDAVAGVATFSDLAVDLAGSYTLGATATGLTGATSAAFTMTDPSTAHPNEPAGMTQVFELDFASISEFAAAGFAGTSDNDLTVQTPATDTMAAQFTRGTTATGRARYIVGFKSGSGPFLTSRSIPSSNTLYADIDIGVSSNWSGERSGVNKSIFLLAGTSASNPIYLSCQGSAQNALTFQVRLQGCPPSKGGNSASGAQNIGCGAMTRGVAAPRIEVIVGMNSVDGSNNGVADGYLKVVRNGSTATERFNMCYRGADATNVGPTAQFNQVKWNPTYGGNSIDVVVAEQYQYLGYWYLSRK